MQQAWREAVQLQDVPVQDIHCLLKGALLQGSVLCAVDAVASDGHEMAAPCHGVTQDSQVAVVHVRAIKLNHTTQLFQQGIPGSFNAQHIDGLDDVIASGSGVVYARHAHHLHHSVACDTVLLTNAAPVAMNQISKRKA